MCHPLATAATASRDSSSAAPGSGADGLAAMETEPAPVDSPSGGGPSTAATASQAPSAPLNPTADVFVSSLPGSQPVA